MITPADDTQRRVPGGFVRGTPQGMAAGVAQREQETADTELDRFLRKVKSAFGFAMGHASTPTSAGIAALESSAKGAKVTESDLADYTQKAAANSMVKGATGSPAGLITVPMSAAETGWSYGFARPAATAALAVSKDSPARKDGLQFSDIQQAWNRSEKVSFGRAVAATPEILPGLSGMWFKIGGMDSYNPWSDESMAEADDNPYYNFLTGGADLALQVVVPPAVKMGRLAAMERVGLRTTLRNATDLAEMRAEDAAHTAGKVTAIGMYIDDLAGQKNISKIKSNPLIANANGADKDELARIISKTDDRDTVREIVFANWGDKDAVKALADAAPDHVWSLADVNSKIRSQWLATGQQFRPTGESLARVNQVFDSALARDEYFTRLRKQFMTEDGFVKQGSTWKPTKSTRVESMRMAAGEFQYATRTGDISDVAPGWLVKRYDAGGAKPVTVFLQWVGSRQPLGTVSRSGARPGELVAEMDAQFNSIPLFRGNRQVTVNGERVSAVAFREGQQQKLIDAAANGNLREAYRAHEDEVVGVMADSLGIPRKEVAEFIRGYRTKADETEAYLAESGGYAFDEVGERMIMDPVTRRQLLDSFFTLPMDEIYGILRSQRSSFYKGGTALQGVGIDLFDFGMKVFRTNVLFRVGYTGKNSVGEPLLASWLAHGTILADEGLSATLSNFGRNRANNIRRVGYLTGLDGVIKKHVKGVDAKSSRQLRREARELVRQRHDTKQVIDNALTELDAMLSGKSSPTMRAQYEDEVRGVLVDAQLRLNAIEDALDNKVPEWRQVVEPANLSDIRARMREYRYILGDDPTYRSEVLSEIGFIRRQASDRGKSISKDYDERIAQLQERLDEQEFNAAYQSQRMDDVSVARDGNSATTRQPGVDNDMARGRDYEGIARQRQIESLKSQIETLKAEKRAAEKAGVDFPEESLTGYERRRLAALEETLTRLDRTPDSVEQVRSLVDALDANYQTLLRQDGENIVSDLSRKVEGLEDELAAIDERMGVNSAELGAARQRESAVAGMRGFHGSGGGTMRVNVGGEYVEVPASFSERAYDFGSGYRAEASAATTSRLTYDPSFRASYEVGRWRRTSTPREIAPDDPQYWDELAYVVNAHFRGDKLVQRILEGQSDAEIKAWLRTRDGRLWQQSMGRDYVTIKETYVPAKGRGRKNVIESATSDYLETQRLVRQYLPDERARKLAAEREVTAGDLQKIMGDRTGKPLDQGGLSRISGEDLVYEPGNKWTPATQWFNRTLDKIWQFIATMPEDRVARWPFYQREFRYQMERRAEIMRSQGIDAADPDVLYAMRQAAHREALTELEKTFYNIRRYNTPVYASRFLMSFPGAFFNSFYRYGRFTYKEPERVFQSLLFANDVFSHFGVDEEGNKVENAADAAYLVIPSPVKFGDEAGIKVPVQSAANFTINYPSLSYLGTIAVGQVVKWNPSNEELIKRALGEEGFNQLFPFGINQSVTDSLLGSYQKDILRAVKGESDAQFMRTAVQIYADAIAQWERTGEGEPPTFENAVFDARAFYLARAGLKFTSPVSVGNRVPGQMMRDAWYAMRAQYGEDTDAARTEFIKQYGDWARWYTFTSSDRSTFIQSQEGFDIVWNQYPGLARKLVGVDEEDPSMVQLMALGADGEFSEPVYTKLQDTPLPGDDVPVVGTMTVEGFDNMVRRDDGWNLYAKGRAKYDAERKRLSIMRDNAASEGDKDYWRGKIAGLDRDFDSWVEVQKSGNPAWAADYGDPNGEKAERTEIYLRMILDDKDFMAGRGKAEIWQKVADFLDQRDRAKSFLTGSTERKAGVKRDFAAYVADKYLKDDPTMTALWDRYFSAEWVSE